MQTIGGLCFYPPRGRKYPSPLRPCPSLAHPYPGTGPTTATPADPCNDLSEYGRPPLIPCLFRAAFSLPSLGFVLNPCAPMKGKGQTRAARKGLANLVLPFFS